MNKQIKTRKSRSCPKCCNSNNCTQTYEQRTIDGKLYWVWVLHCETTDRIHKRILKGGI